jgi:hypothetical protein
VDRVDREEVVGINQALLLLVVLVMIHLQVRHKEIMEGLVNLIQLLEAQVEEERLKQEQMLLVLEILVMVQVVLVVMDLQIQYLEVLFFMLVEEVQLHGPALLEQVDRVEEVMLSQVMGKLIQEVVEQELKEEQQDRVVLE